MGVQRPKAVLFFTFLASVSLLQPVAALDAGSLHHPQRQPNCSCSTISGTDPLVLTPLTHVYRQSPSACRSLGRQLEAKRRRKSRKRAVKDVDVDWEDLEDFESAPTQLLEAPSPIHTEVLLGATAQDSTEGTIVCRPVPFEGFEEWWETETSEDDVPDSTGSWETSNGTFGLICLVVLVVLGVLAEVIEWVVFRSVFILVCALSFLGPRLTSPIPVAYTTILCLL